MLQILVSSSKLFGLYDYSSVVKNFHFYFQAQLSLHVKFLQKTRFAFQEDGNCLIHSTSSLSISYNKAIARSNTEIIANAVIILFITDLDEQFFTLLMAIDDRIVIWLSGKAMEEVEQIHDGRSHDETTLLQSLQCPPSSSIRHEQKNDLETETKDKIENARLLHESRPSIDENASEI